MSRIPIRVVSCLLVISSVAVQERIARAEGEGQTDLDEAMRAKVTAQDMNDLNQVVQLLESALQKGLDEENTGFATQMLSDALLERASGLLEILNRIPPERVAQDEEFRQQVVQMSRLIRNDLLRILSGDDPPPVAKLQMSRLILKLGGDRAEARQLLDEFLQSVDADEGDETPAIQVADAYMLRASLHGDAEKAIEDLNRSIQLDSETTRYLLARAALYRSQGENDKALQDAEAVIELEPSDETGYLVQAEIYQAEGRTDDAMTSLDKANEVAPQAWKPYQYRGQLLRSRGELDAAIQQFTKALQQDPALVDTLLSRAEAYMENKQYELAAADIETALEHRPGWLTALRLKAQILASSDKLTEAIDELNQVVASGGSIPEVHLQLALYYLVDEQPRRAVAQYTKVIEQVDDSFLALRHRGDAYITLGEHHAAMTDFEAALKLQPSDSMLLNNLAWLLATSPDEDVRDGKRAVELATRASELTEFKEAFILSTLAAAYAEAGDFEMAKQWSEKAVEINTRDDQAQQLAGELDSYREGKPWRERQTVEEDADTSDGDAQGVDEKPAEQSIDF